VTDLLLDDAGAECIGATDLHYVCGTAKHLGHKFVSREQDRQSAWVIMPNLVGHQPES
jgi:hypothetical protein